MALTDPDETFYAETAKEMLSRNEWPTPYLCGKPQFEKPILFYWLVEVSFKILGVNEFAARMPSAIFALLGVIGMYLLGSLIFNKRVGLLAAIILGTSVEYIILSRACVTDMTLATFMLFGALFFFYGYLRHKRYHYLFSAASFALATLTKGPVAIILPGAAILAYLAFVRDLKALKKIPLFWCAVIFIAIAAPWYLLEYKIHGANFINSFFGFHNITRFLEAEHKIGSQVYYNIPIVFGGFFPWSVFLPFGFWHIFKKKHSAFILSWFFIIFLFFTASSTKLPTYVFPCFISLALIVAVLWDDLLKEGAPKKFIKGMSVSYYALCASVIFGAIAALLYLKFIYNIRSDHPSIYNEIFVSSLFLIFGMILSLIAFINKKFFGAFLFIAYSVIVFLYPMNRLVLPEIERYETSKEIALKLGTLMKEGEQLGSESNYLEGLAFYTGRFPTDIDKHHIMVNFLSSDKRVWCVLKEKNHRELYDLDTKPYCMRESYMVYKIGKRAIVTNNMPDDGVYMIKRERRV